ncbi:GNAT family N-acetyltransferase [Cellulomonas sp. NPDC089187]|uniref:GNAT family N-acetyltransferase n=1 Tax=Cellulomonas sp. NPDC089187 TaxID=3154970 RepID=UPI00342A635B
MTTRTLRSDDPELAVLLDAGARVVTESWGARLHRDDLNPARLTALVARVTGQGIAVGELTVTDLPRVLDLHRATRADYPEGPATPRPDLDRNSAVALFGEGRVFGASDGEALVAMTAVERLSDRVETAFTAVRAPHRGRGIATAVKAASVLALAAEGAELFGTGGAGDNAASLGMNRAVGYAVTERWVTVRP